jgi:hypothetical protein
MRVWSSSLTASWRVVSADPGERGGQGPLSGRLIRGCVKIVGGTGSRTSFLWLVVGDEGTYSGDWSWLARESASMIDSCPMRVGV